jgi:hypothetical protein
VTRIRVLVSLFALLTFCSVSRAQAMASPVEVRPIVRLSGATFIPFELPEMAHGYGVAVGLRSVGLGVGEFAVLLGGAGVLPASDGRGHFGVIYLEGSWHPLSATLSTLDVPLSPYILVGACLATPDLVGRRSRPEVVRWTESSFSPLPMVGMGVSFGTDKGLFIAADWRVYGAHSTGPTLSGGYTF